MKTTLLFSLYAFAAAGGVTVGLLWPNVWIISLLVLLLGLLSYRIFIWPKYRYYRLAVSLISGWVALRAFPMIFVEYVSKNQSLTVFFGDDGQWWPFDVGVTIISVSLITFDFLSNNANALSRLKQLTIGQFQSQKNTNQSNQFGNVGDNSPITIVNEAQFDAKSVIENGLRDLENGKSDVVIQSTFALLLHHGDKLSAQQRHLAYVNLGKAYQQIEDLKNSSKYFLKAYDAQPESEQGMAYRAAAHLNLMDFPNARDFAQQTLDQHSSSELALSINLRLDESDKSTEQIFSEIPRPLQSSDEILHGAFSRALMRLELEQAEQFLKELRKLKPGKIGYQAALGGILVKKVLFARRGQIQMSANEIADSINAAKKLLNNSLGTNTPLANGAKTEALYSRAIASHISEDNDGAYSDFCSAIELSPKNRHLMYQFGLFMLQTNQHAKAIEIFEGTVDQSDDFGPHLMLARLLIQRGDAGDHQHAFEVLAPLRENLADLVNTDLFEFAQVESHLLEIDGSAEDATTYISSMSNLPDYLKQILYAEILIRNRRQDEAKNIIDEAIEPAIESSDYGECYQLAQILGSLGEYEGALRVLKEITGPTSYPDGIELLLQCAHKVGEKKFILEFCERLRNNGVYNDFALELEIATYEKIHEFEKALDILNAEIARSPESYFAKTLRVRRSFIGIRKRKNELIENDPALLPSIEECQPPEFGCNVAAVLAKSDEPIRGAEYLYELVRRNFENRQIHGAMAFLFGMDDQDFPEPVWGDTVDVGCAIRFKEDGKNHEDWYVIEDSENPSLSRRELDPSSALAEELIGKKVDDRFYIRKHEIQDRMGTITHITGKMRFRKFDSMLNSEERFPGSPFGISIQTPMKENGDIDGPKFIEMLEKADDPIRELENWAKRYPVTPVFFAQVTGKSVFECLMHFISDQNRVVLCRNGSADEFAVSSSAFDEHNKIVLDASALTTLFATQFVDHLVASKFEFIVCESTIQQFRNLLLNNDSALWSKTSTSTLGGKFHFNERSDEQIQKLQEDLELLIAWVEKNCRIAGGAGALELPNQTRRQVTEILGIETLEAIGAAVKENALLWTDDIAVSVFVSEESHCPTIWSDLMFEKLVESKAVGNELATEAKTKLLCFGYSFTRINPNVLRNCIDQSEFDPNSSPLLELLEWFYKNQVDPRYAARLAIQMLMWVWKDSNLGHKPIQLTKALIRSIGKRNDGLQIFQMLFQLVGPAFSVNVVAATACHDAIVSEIQLLDRKSTLILPGDVDWPLG